MEEQRDDHIPLLDSKPTLTVFNACMVDAFWVIIKGRDPETGLIPLSEIKSYYEFLENEPVFNVGQLQIHLCNLVTRKQFIYLIYQMNEPMLEDLRRQREAQQKKMAKGTS